jgi:hypothetical protein
MENEEEYIFLKIKIGSEIDITNFDIIIELKKILNHVSYEIFDTNRSMSIYIWNIDLTDKLEKFLDSYMNIYNDYRYYIAISQKNKKFPTTIRINKKGNKIITKNQTKLMSI